MTAQTFILPTGKAALLDFIERLPMARKWKVVVSLYRKTRSNAQNNALWGVAYPTIRESTGNEAEDLHTTFCGEYFGWVDYVVMGHRRKRPRRTTTTDENGKRDVISTADFMDFYANVQRISAEFGVYVPDPGE